RAADRARVGREDRRRRGDPVEQGEEGALVVEPLDHGLDDELGVPRPVLQAGRPSQPAQGALRVRLREPSPLYPPRHVAAVAGVRSIERLRPHIHHRGGAACQRAQHRDLVAHRPGAHHAQPPHRFRLHGCPPRRRSFPARDPYRAVAPPSTTSTCPVTKSLAGLARNTAAPFRSSSPPRRPIGMVLRIASPRCSISHCVIRLGKNPGAMAFTVIRCRAHFTARSRVKAITAPLLALYPIASSTSASVPARPATLAILMILPPRPVSIMWRPTARLTSMVPVTFVSSTLCHASSGISRTGAPHVAPALLMRTSTR